MRQGFILPDGYKKNYFINHSYKNVKRPINTGECYLPIWGRVYDGHTYSAVVETPYDASVCTSFGKHGAFLDTVLMFREYILMFFLLCKAMNASTMITESQEKKV